MVVFTALLATLPLQLLDFLLHLLQDSVASRPLHPLPLLPPAIIPQPTHPQQICPTPLQALVTATILSALNLQVYYKVRTPTSQPPVGLNRLAPVPLHLVVRLVILLLRLRVAVVWLMNNSSSSL